MNELYEPARCSEIERMVNSKPVALKSAILREDTEKEARFLQVERTLNNPFRESVENSAHGAEPPNRSFIEQAPRHFPPREARPRRARPPPLKIQNTLAYKATPTSTPSPA
eukprot:CAMPEP_0174887264 /NCGR_PEP_ID=MMETSP0167-20121228/2526_1 /TAXON_ID=38298 /ORGANISM="Rhodella maculata, Strain CCMP736" /LENGTH=110 /DNA_ID=CAMNT_0016123675 /DNA_START=328 /DNA_END=658 /DNA_ORIENTATION=+